MGRMGRIFRSCGRLGCTARDIRTGRAQVGNSGLFSVISGTGARIRHAILHVEAFLGKEHVRILLSFVFWVVLVYLGK